MTLLHPWVLLLIIPIVWLVWTWYKIPFDAQNAFFRPDLFVKLHLKGKEGERAWEGVMLVLVGLCAVIALSRPVLPPQGESLTTQGIDIVVGIDISHSMSAEDITPSRAAVARQKVDDILSLSPHDRVGIIAFSKSAFIVSPLTQDKEIVKYLSDALNVESMMAKGTDLASVVMMTSKVCKAPRKGLILLTDGGDNDDMQSVITLAKTQGIALFIIGIATPQGATLVDENNQTLVDTHGEIVVSALHPDIEDLATQTGGLFVPVATTNRDVRDILEALHHFSTSHTSQSVVYAPREMFMIPLGMGMALWFFMMFRIKRPWGLHGIALLLSISLTQGEAAMWDFWTISQGTQAYKKGDYDQAVEMFGAIAQRSKTPQALYNYANALYKTKRYKAAIDTYKKIVTDDPLLQGRILHNLGNAYAMREEYDEARQAYTQALTKNNDPQTRANLAMIQDRINPKSGVDKGGSAGDQGEKRQKSQGGERAKDPQGASSSSSQGGGGGGDGASGGGGRSSMTQSPKVTPFQSPILGQKPLSGRQISDVYGQGGIAKEEKPW